MATRAEQAKATREKHLRGVLCFCHGIEQTSGHPLNSPGCRSEVKAGTHPSRSRGTPGAGGSSTDIYSTLARLAATPQARRRYRQQAAISRAAGRFR